MNAKIPGKHVKGEKKENKEKETQQGKRNVRGIEEKGGQRKWRV